MTEYLSTANASALRAVFEYPGTGYQGAVAPLRVVQEPDAAADR
jgi:hypothetical protein